MTPTRILIFAKAPVAGRVKTRLIPALGAEGAARLAKHMLEQIVGEALATGLAVELCGEPHPGAWYEGPVQHLSGQGDGDLGERLARASARILDAGENVLLVGSDCPELDRRRLEAAAEALARHDAVIHPAHDGGYALLGLTRFDARLFSAIAWSSSEVGSVTISRITALGWSLHVGDTLRDVDVPRDLAAAGID